MEERSTALRRQRSRGGAHDLCPEGEVADQAPLLRDPEFGPVAELARLADVMHESRGHQQVGVEPGMELADLADKSADRDGVLDQSADVGVMTARECRARV